MNQGLCKAGIKDWSCISGLSRFKRMNTVDSIVENESIHLYFHLMYVNSPAIVAKNEYHSLVSPMVLRGGRPRVIQRPQMKPAIVKAERTDVRHAALRRRDNDAADAATERATAPQAKYMNVPQSIILQVL